MTWAERVRLEIRNGRITHLEADCDPAPDDERHGLALPGLPNVHSHGFQRGMAGLTERHATEISGSKPDNFWSWRELMYRFVDRLGPDDLEALTAQAYVEMLESGTTRVGEFHYLHHGPDGRGYSNLAEMAERVVAAAATTGIGLTLLPVLYCHSGFGGTAATAGQRRFINELDSYAQLLDRSRAAVVELPDANVGVAPHSLRATTPAQLRAAVELAGEGPIHIHVAEQIGEVEACVAWSGQRPAAWLLDHEAVSAQWCLIHATHLDDAELQAFARTGAVAGLCPITEANLGDGIFRAHEFLAAGGRFGIGSDSNLLLDAAQELRALEYSQRLTTRARNVLASEMHSTGRRLFEGSWSGGVQALGLPGEVGLKQGAPADIVSLDRDHPTLVERQHDALLDSWIFAGGHNVVDCVWRYGRKVVSGGRHIAREAIAARYRQSLQKLLA
ncbi:MAG: formimidoylglutamate deiminase [Gammaproteobacteria bacterium]